MSSVKVVRLTKLILDFMFYSGAVVCLTIPVTFKAAGSFYPIFREFYIQMCILFFASGILAVFIIGELRKIFKTVISENCFVMENVVSLKKMGSFSFLISIVTCLRLFFVLTPATLIIIIVFFIAGLFSYVLSQVFDQAVKFKMENDLTI